MELEAKIDGHDKQPRQPKIGEHLGRLRRQAGLSQEALAEKSGVSLSVIQGLEQGKRDGALVRTLAFLAAALGVDTTALMGNAASAVAQREPDAEPVGLVGVRRALTPVYGLDDHTYDPDPAGPPPTVASVTAAVAHANRIYHGNDYGQVLAAAPGLLGQARALVGLTVGDEQLAAHVVASRAYSVTGRLLIQLRQVDLAHVALDTALQHARHSGDQVVGAETVAHMCWLLLRVGRFAEARALAIRTADQVEPRMSTATPAQLAAWGFLLVKAASAAVRDARRDEAAELLDLAEAGAHRLGDRSSGHAALIGNDYSAEAVQCMRVESAVVAGQPGRALDLAARMPHSPQVTPSSRQRHRLDLAWSSVQTGQYTDAIQILVDLRDAAPAWLRNQAYARTIMAELDDRRRRAMTEEEAAIAALVGYVG